MVNTAKAKNVQEAVLIKVCSWSWEIALQPIQDPVPLQ